MALFEPGEVVTLIGDLWPGNVTMVGFDGDPITPPELPQNTQAILFRILITNHGLVVAYQFSGEIRTVELPVPEEQTLEVTHRGGVVGPYTVGDRVDCRCKARMLSTLELSHVFPGNPVVTESRSAKALVDAKKDSSYGLIPRRGPVRYSRA